MSSGIAFYSTLPTLPHWVRLSIASPCVNGTLYIVFRSVSLITLWQPFVQRNQPWPGTIADKLRSIARKLPNTPEKQEWEGAAQSFFDLATTERNRLVHAKPGTNSDGEQRLFYFGYEWTIERVQIVADRFAQCGHVLNDLFHRP